MANLYESILALCERDGIRPGRLCDELGISRGLMTDLKMGRKKGVNAETAQKIASFFGVSVGYLLGIEGSDAVNENTVNLEQVDVAFYGDFKELSEEEKAVINEFNGDAQPLEQIKAKNIAKRKKYRYDKKYKKAVDILAIDIAEKASFADYLVVATGNSDRQVNALMDDVEDAFAKNDLFVKNVEGKHGSGWVLMDFGDIIVNIFTKEMREKYGIEKVWGDCTFLDIAE